jgi:hypothetical protein
MDMSNVGRFLKLWTKDNGAWAFIAEDESRVDVAVQQYIQARGDTLLDLTLMGGDSFRLLASYVACWMVSTPEGRHAEIKIGKASTDERDNTRQELGIWEQENGN